MKIRLKIVKEWTDPNKKVWPINSILELDNKDVAATAIFDGFAEHAPTATMTEPTGHTVDINKAVTDALPGAVDAALERMQKSGKGRITVFHDRSDDDPSFGFLPEKSAGHVYSPAEKLHGLGLFTQDVYQAGEGFTNPSERLMKCVARSKELIQKGVKDGIVQKAAGTGLTVGANEAVGALMPPIINTMLLDAASETAIVRPRCANFPISGAMEISFPKIKGYDRSSGLVHGGVVAYWRSENQLLKESNPETEEIRLNLNALTALAFASHRVMKFAPIDVGAFLLPKMADAITFREEDAFINGTGAGMPLGILRSARVTIAKEANQVAATVVTQNIDKMLARIRIERPGSTVFMYNRADLYTQLIALSRVIGVGGVLAALYQHGPAGTGTLAGFPCVNNDHCQAVGTEGDIFLCDWSQYLIADDRSGPETAQSMHLKFDYGQEAFRIIKYVDGQSLNTAVYTPHRGSNTTAGIVTLGARA